MNERIAKTKIKNGRKAKRNGDIFYILTLTTFYIGILYFIHSDTFEIRFCSFFFPSFSRFLQCSAISTINLSGSDQMRISFYLCIFQFLFFFYCRMLCAFILISHIGIVCISLYTMCIM